MAVYFQRYAATAPPIMALLMHHSGKCLGRCHISRGTRYDDLVSMTPQVPPFRTWLGLFKKALSDFGEDKALRLSAALAYYSGFSIAPLLIITIAMAGWFLGSEAVAGKLDDQMRQFMGPHGAAAIQDMVRSASKPAHGVVATVVGFATLLLGASGVFGALKDALNTIWEVKVKPNAGWRGLLRERFMNFGMVLVICFLLLSSLVLSTMIAALGQLLENHLHVPAFVWAIITAVVSVGIVSTLFALIFKVLPDVEVEWRDVWVGGLLTGLLFEVGKSGLSWYLGRESMANAYGAAGSVVLVLLWVYYTSCILFLGAEFTQVYAQAGGRRILPSAHAEPVSTSDREQQGLPEAAPETSPASGLPPYAAAPGIGMSPPSFAFGGASSHKLMAPMLKYLEARGLILSLEAKDALRQSVSLVTGVAVIAVATLAAWILLVTALIGFLVQLLNWDWMPVMALTGGIHVLFIGGVGLWIWQRFKGMTWFNHSIKELKKDRQWLQGKTVNA